MYVYLIKNGDLHNIGITDDFERRMKELKPDRIICKVEQANPVKLKTFLHQKFVDRRLPQSEYFRLSTDEVNAAIVEMNNAATWIETDKDAKTTENREEPKRNRHDIIRRVAFGVIAIGGGLISGVFGPIQMSLMIIFVLYIIFRRTPFV